MSGPPEITQFFGHLHPLLVHLPIGLIVLLAILEALAQFPRFKNAGASNRFILALAVPLSVFTVICGLMLSLGGSYGERLLQWHKWTGIGTAAACCLAALFYRLDLKRMYRVTLFGTMVALVVASHFGGSLTHGSDYLVRFAPAPFRAWLGAEGGAKLTAKSPDQVMEMRAFADIVQPMLKADCVSCHGPEKAESELRLDSLAALLKGGKSGAVIIEGKPGESSLVKRMQLPRQEKEHMPPEGKPQPDSDLIKVVQWWISAGVPAEKTVRELKPSPRLFQALQARYGIPGANSTITPPKPVSEIQPLAAKIADDLNIAVTLLSPKEPWLQVNASIAGTNFGDAELAKLAPLAANVRWLDLAGTSISDNGLSMLGAMPNLSRLHLERTSTTDLGLSHLAALTKLEYLNLYAAEVTDSGLEKLRMLPRLKQLYLWKTKVTPAAATAFVEELTDNDELRHLQEEVDLLKARIKSEHISVELGAPITPSPGTNAAPGTNSAPVNAQCPVSGKAVDLAKTVVYEGKLIAFCCDDCKSKFQSDPKPWLAKLVSSPSKTESKPKSN